MTPAPVMAAIGLGGNQGDVLAALGEALRCLPDALTRLVGVSPVYRTRALTQDNTTAPDYWNAAATLETQLAPDALLARLLEIEAQLGRVRRHKWASRTLDLDLLLYRDLMLASPNLSVPHPGLVERAFVLAPLADIAADWRIPPGNMTVAESLRALNDSARALLLERREHWLST